MSRAVHMPNDIVADAVRKFEADRYRDGDIISHEWLKWALDIPEPRTVPEARRIQFMWLGRVEDFKQRMLTEKQIALESVYGKGYRVVPPRDQAGYAAEVASAYIAKGFRHGKNIIRNTRVSQLTAEERRRHDDTTAKMDSFRQMAKRERRSMMAAFGK